MLCNNLNGTFITMDNLEYRPLYNDIPGYLPNNADSNQGNLKPL